MAESFSPRLPGWEARLAALVAAAAARPYRLGEHDCWLFACACARALTGTDMAARLPGAYATHRDALRLIRRLGGPVRAASSLVGAEPAPVARARRGDWLLYEDGRGAHLGVCLGPVGAVLTETGLQELPVGRFKCCWMIG
jgi:hypothetical protein